MAKPLYCFWKNKDTDLEELNKQIQKFKSGGFDIAVCFRHEQIITFIRLRRSIFKTEFFSIRVEITRLLWMSSKAKETLSYDSVFSFVSDIA